MYYMVNHTSQNLKIKYIIDYSLILKFKFQHTISNISIKLVYLKKKKKKKLKDMHSII